ncbi:phosphogluconate dehydratase [Arcobacter sp.]|uniref:phosphogluconate dehydratase n=1 Tax=Arcobacter sp. TaxID=1872629 RepID=UPI003D12EC81
MNEIIQNVTNNIIKRSKETRKAYLLMIEESKQKGRSKKAMGCSNLAHTIAPMSESEKELLMDMEVPNIGIISAYNDMLSAHEPYKEYPDIIKTELLKNKATAQVAGGVPAMCDGVTQGKEGMELSLFSRDNIAMGTAIGLSHNAYDGAIYLGVCDKIVPGLLMGALSFGHLPAVFVPSGPMSSGISNSDKAKKREEFEKGKIDKNELLKVEAQSYHSCGTCTFFGTANSNQMLLEMMGLQLPNSSFVNTNTPLREKLTKKATNVLLDLIKKDGYSLSEIIDERSFVNAIVGLMATGGSTNHTIHLIAMAKVAGIKLTWDDFDAISKVTPLLCKMYPNGSLDVNHFRDAGGMGVVISELLKAGLVHNDVKTIMGIGLDAYCVEPKLIDDELVFEKDCKVSRNNEVISSIETPYSLEGGLKLLTGNIGRSIIKTSALKEEQLYVKAPAMVFSSQEELKDAFKEGKLYKDFIAVVKNQGPKANGMPELHGLLPIMGLIQNMGYKVAIVTDGRMSGASGKVPSAIHLVDESVSGGKINNIQDGDMICLDVKNGKLSLEIDAGELIQRININKNNENKNLTYGRFLFETIRENVSDAEDGATIFKDYKEDK